MSSKFPAFAVRNDAPLDDAVAALCNHVEALAPGAKSGVCIASADRTMLVRAIFPNVPSEFQDHIRQIPMAPPYFGACNAVIHQGTIFTCHDMTKEDRFDARFVRLCVDFGIMSLQSRPVLGRDDKPIGTFVLTYGNPLDEHRYGSALMAHAVEAARDLLQRELDRNLLAGK